MKLPAPRYFCRFAETVATHANLPHWSQTCACFVTFRLADSLPQERLRQWRAEREAWLDAHPQPWTEEAANANLEMLEKVEKWLDAGAGSCVLGDAGAREIVEGVLRRFDGEQYVLYAFVVMPNHVHVLFMPMADFKIRDVVQSWKSVSAHAVNRHLGRTGALWQKESWDRLVRDARAFESCRAYVVANAPALAYDACAGDVEWT